MHFLERLDQLKESGVLPTKIVELFLGIYTSYEKAIKANGYTIDEQMPLLNKYLDLVISQLKNPYSFQYYHKAILTPFDYHQFGNDFLRPVVQMGSSTILGSDKIFEIKSHLKKNHNVVLFSNHQTEPDPQVINLLLERDHKNFAQTIIFVAGHRVTQDPLSIPFSLGLNLLCIYAKNYIDHPPERKQEKIQHNRCAIKVLQQLLSKGGKCVYVAPAGGRDRPNKEGQVEVSFFDPKSVEMFLFTAKLSKKTTHFYPLALKTFDLLPPPDRINFELGESRLPSSAAVHLGFGSEINLTMTPGYLSSSKRREEKLRQTERIYQLVKDLYKQIQ